jgi:hypothetical protein
MWPKKIYNYPSKYCRKELPTLGPCVASAVRSSLGMHLGRSLQLYFGLEIYPPWEAIQPWSLRCGASIMRGPLVGEGVLVASCVDGKERRKMRWLFLCFR